MATKILTVLGSTGSIGSQTLEVVNNIGIEVAALTAGSNAELLIEQAKRFRPKIACIADETKGQLVRSALSGTGIKVLCGDKAVCETAAEADADTVLSSIVGVAGLAPTAAAIKSGRNIALANKETLVTAGAYITSLCKKNNVSLLPVDSEHSAIFQCLQGLNDRKEIKRILLTASGGPFFGYSADKLSSVTAEQALNHPNWKMGRRVTIDSASLMNKGFEVIEALWLFGVAVEDITVVVHRQSVVHSMVEFADGSVVAQLASPDMRLPIQYALTYPERRQCCASSLDIFGMKDLTFEQPDDTVFPALSVCKRAIKMGGLAPAAVNAADEVAVDQFLKGNIGFRDMALVAENALTAADTGMEYSLDDVFAADAAARVRARDFIEKLRVSEML